MRTGGVSPCVVPALLGVCSVLIEGPFPLGCNLVSVRLRLWQVQE